MASCIVSLSLIMQQQSSFSLGNQGQLFQPFLMFLVWRWKEPQGTRRLLCWLCPLWKHSSLRDKISKQVSCGSEKQTIESGPLGVSVRGITQRNFWAMVSGCGASTGKGHQCERSALCRIFQCFFEAWSCYVAQISTERNPSASASRVCCGSF